MPDSDITDMPVYGKAYKVNLYDAESEFEYYSAGQPVTVTPKTPAGKVFDKWEAIGITIAYPYNPNLTFTMPSAEVIITAKFKDQTPTPTPDPDPTPTPDPDPTPTPDPDPTPTPCTCDCHAGGIKAFFFNFINFFKKLFSKDARTCECGAKH